MERGAEPIITSRSLSRIYRLGGFEVVGLKDISLEIAPGEFVVLKGNSGSGKSTLLALLSGLDRPTHGDLLVAGHNLRQASPRQLIAYRRETVGIVFQSFNLLPTLTVMENVCLPGFLAGHPRLQVQIRARELLEWLQMGPRHHHRPSQLSGGEMQRTSIARALINDPAIILADEPTGNLDSRNGQIVVDLLAGLHTQHGRTVVLATHSSLADSCATRILHLKDGTIA